MSKIYRIEELILNKYGALKFALGCELTINWINNTPPISKPLTLIELHIYCSAKKDNLISPITIVEAKKIMDLFSLKSPKEIFTNPSDLPDYLNCLDTNEVRHSNENSL